MKPGIWVFDADEAVAAATIGIGLTKLDEELSSLRAFDDDDFFRVNNHLRPAPAAFRVLLPVDVDDGDNRSNLRLNLLLLFLSSSISEESVLLLFRLISFDFWVGIIL